MMIGCDQCRALVTADQLRAEGQAPAGCGRILRVVRFPAFASGPQRWVATPEEPVAGGSCFRHAAAPAVAVCADSGAFLCELCRIRVGTVDLAPAAATRRMNEQRIGEWERGRFLWDGLALGLMVPPVALAALCGMVAWSPGGLTAAMTILVLGALMAPVALVLVIHAWRRRLSLVPRKRGRLMVAGGLAALLILGGLGGFGILASIILTSEW